MKSRIKASRSWHAVMNWRKVRRVAPERIEVFDREPVLASVQQALMRHADPRMTLAYGEAVTSSEREADSRVVNRFLNGGKEPV